MGYYTRYDLKIEQLEVTDQKAKSIQELILQITNSNEVDRVQLIKDLQAIENPPVDSAEGIINQLRSINENAEYTLDENGDPQEPAKWYEHETDLQTFSKRFPNWLFTLTGEGEESGNLWKKYFLNGKVQEAQAIISYDAFDIKKLR